MFRRPSRLVPLVALALALGLAPAASAGKVVTIKGAPAAGPAKYDRVFVEKHGPENAKTVLVLIPGTSGGAGSVAPVAADLAKRGKSLQVWGFDRREQAFEDTSGFKGGDPDKALDYYLGFKYKRVLSEDVPFVAEWGFATELNDLRRVIARASDGGRRKVILGGHSRGASSAVAYAAWDFAGKPGFRDLDGLVLIDGGLAAFGPQKFTEKEARDGLADIRGGQVFNDVLGTGIPEIGQIFSEVTALYARKRPQQRSALQDNPLVPEFLRPPFPVTNEAFLAQIFDKTTSPPAFAALRIRAGDYAPEGDPRPWADGENTAIQRFAGAFSREPANATEWYYPRRMILDTSAANALKRTPAADALGLRLFHTKRIDIPLYVFQTDLTFGGVVRGAETLVESSRIRNPQIVDPSNSTSNLDPVIAGPEGNRFTRTVEGFLRKVQRRR